MNASSTERLIHPFAPVFDRRSQVLILGTFPSPRTRAAGFYYGHPRNRFWDVLAVLLETPKPELADRRTFLLSHRIALWDVLASCEIRGASDASIRQAKANDLAPLLKAAPIRRVYANGGTAARLFRAYQARSLGIDCVELPSTSPANARFTLEHLAEAWRIILGDLVIAEDPVIAG